MSDINWREELLDSAKFNQKEEKFLKDGPKSLTDSWFLGALYTRWFKIKDYRESPTPNCQSSLLEWGYRLDNGDFYILNEEDFSYPNW